MSHNVLIQNVKITSLDALRRAITELHTEGVNVALLEQTTFRTYRGQDNRCDLCISLPNGNYDVGLKLQRDGSYIPICDASMMPRDGSSISCRLGPGVDWSRAAIGKLMQRYSTCVAEDSLQLSGYFPTREIDAQSGEIYVTVEY